MDLTALRENHLPAFEEAYLAPWTRYGDPDEIANAYALAKPLSAAYYAPSSWLYVLPGLEETWEEENMFVYYARMILDEAEVLASVLS